MCICGSCDLYRTMGLSTPAVRQSLVILGLEDKIQFKHGCQYTSCGCMGSSEPTSKIHSRMVPYYGLRPQGAPNCIPEKSACSPGKALKAFQENLAERWPKRPGKTTKNEFRDVVLDSPSRTTLRENKETCEKGRLDFLPSDFRDLNPRSGTLFAVGRQA